MSESNKVVSCGQSNWFRVRDLSSFKKALVDFNVAVVEHESDDHLVSILADPRPDTSFIVDQKHILEVIIRYLIKDSVAVLFQIGYQEGTMVLMGNALAANHTGDLKQLDLNYIYKVAADMTEGEVLTTEDPYSAGSTAKS